MASLQLTSASEPLPFKIVFMGTPQLAARILQFLLTAPPELCRVIAVVTRPDQPRGRGLTLASSEVGSLAEARGIPVLKPAKIRASDFVGQLTSFAPDLLVVAAYGRILPNDVLGAAKLMPMNVHMSLLPKFRGASPVEGAILAGETETGITIMRVTEPMDAGPILLQRKVPAGDIDTQGSLKAKLAELGGAALLEALNLLRRGELSETAQNDDLATYTSPITKENAVIDWQSNAARIERMVRAYDPWPVARTRLGSDELLIWRAHVLPIREPESATAPAGTLLKLSPGPIVKCGEGLLELLELQASGRRRMAATDFFRGRRIVEGERLGG
ncbi:MAG: methionyl-tRNA formyltransferase [Deltaproteobacteria bacterium]|nr:methionyl-tRNA formyltransferase [Deltaproteobacteria bacterium]